MTRVRVLLHALDRTGPPMLALALLRWTAANLPEWDLEVISFRGGALENEVAGLAPTQVMLRPDEAWDHAAPDTERLAELRLEMTQAEPADLTLLVSVSAGQCLTVLPDDDAPVVTWVVEQGEDLHWLGAPVDVGGRTDRWLAGSEGTATELATRLGPQCHVAVAPEFIEPWSPDPAAGGEQRVELLGSSAHHLVIAAGIGTWRKAPDLFVEVALAHRRRYGPGTRFVWIGGELDPLVPLLHRMTSELDLDDLVRWVPNTAGLADYVAAADLLLHPARLDAFPLVCLQAAAAGIPVVAFDGVGGVPEMMGEHFIGAQYPDIEGLAASVEQLLDPPVGQRVAAAQGAHVRSMYVADVAAPQLVEALTASLHHRHGTNR